jgi:putative ABC transport system substrate-binding protein
MQFNQLKRRDFITLLGGAAVGWPVGARAQQAKGYTIGVLVQSEPNPNPLLDALRAGLRDAGYGEDRNLRLEIRSADAKPHLQLEAATELVRLKVDLIVAFLTQPSLAAKQATREIPIVIVAGDPVATGLVASLARPGGNITGLSTGAEVATKGVEVMRELLPSARSIGVVVDDTNPFTRPYLTQIGDAARSAGLETQILILRPGQPLPAALEALAGKRVEAALIAAGPAQSKEFFDLAIKHRIATVTVNRLGPPLGALMSYASDFFVLARQSATYVDKILKGAKPADLPVAFPTKFELIINLKTAKAIGLEIPPTLLARADEVIE